MTSSRIVWAAFLASQAAFLVVALSLEPRGLPPPRAVAVAFGVLAAFQAVLADLFFRRAERLAAAPPGRGAPTEEARRPAALRRALVAWALDETIALLGLVLALLGASASTWGGFGVVAVVLLVLHRPRG